MIDAAKLRSDIMNSLCDSLRCEDHETNTYLRGKMAAVMGSEVENFIETSRLKILELTEEYRVSMGETA